MCTESREFHVIINGSDMGLAVGNISPSIYRVIDIYGRCAEVELVHDSDISAGLEEPALPTQVSRDHSLCFSHIHGANAVIKRKLQDSHRIVNSQRAQCSVIGHCIEMNCLKSKLIRLSISGMDHYN